MDPIENGDFPASHVSLQGYYYTKEFMAPIHGLLDMKTRPVSLRPRETIRNLDHKEQPVSSKKYCVYCCLRRVRYNNHGKTGVYINEVPGFLFQII